MAKLYFRYGAMNSGKSTALLQAAYNYAERGQQVLLAKPGIDAKGDRSIVSRLGVVRPVDFLIDPRDDVLELFFLHRGRVLAGTGSPVACLLIDEAQFLTGQQVDDLFRVAVAPDAQHSGVGRALLAFAERRALGAGVRELRLYTHERMTANIALYERLGYRITWRAEEDGFARVHMAKTVQAKSASGADE